MTRNESIAFVIAILVIAGCMYLIVFGHKM